MITEIIVGICALAVGFVVGVLFERRNSNKAEPLINKSKEELQKIKTELEERIKNLKNN